MSLSCCIVSLYSLLVYGTIWVSGVAVFHQTLFCILSNGLVQSLGALVPRQPMCPTSALWLLHYKSMRDSWCAVAVMASVVCVWFLVVLRKVS